MIESGFAADFHMHTCFSADSEARVRDMIESAIDKGLATICFTDHEDKDYPQDGSFVIESPDTYVAAMQRYQEEYKSQIDIRIGVEIGLQPHLAEYYHKFVNAYPFDFVIGSIHVVGGMDPYYGAFFEGKSDEEAYRETFYETVRCIELIEDFDVLGHIDYVVRYGKQKAKDYSYGKFQKEIDDILKTLIAHGKGIELNTSGWKYGLPFCHPHPDVIRRYRELGGKIITIGADGHKPEHVAYEFCKVAPTLRQCGFTEYTEFKERKPYFKQLP